jgi:hypothetical protein
VGLGRVQRDGLVVGLGRCSGCFEAAWQLKGGQVQAGEVQLRNHILRSGSSGSFRALLLGVLEGTSGSICFNEAAGQLALAACCLLFATSTGMNGTPD